MNGDHALESLLVPAIFLIGAIGVRFLLHQSVRWWWFAIAVGLQLAHDFLVSNAFGALPIVIGVDWNWQGKLIVTAFGIMLALAWFGRRETGLISGSKLTTREFGIFVAILAIYIAVALYFPGRDTSPERIAYQATMPGIAEETFYRGVLLYALDRTFAARCRIAGVELGWGALLVTISFGCAHGLSYTDGTVQFAAFAFAYTFATGLAFLSFRLRTGSVLVPIALHNCINLILTLV